MKKNIISLSLLGLLVAVLFLPAVAMGATTGPPDGCTMSQNVGVAECPGAGGTCSFSDNSPCGVCCLLSTVYSITNWVFIFLIALTTVFVIWGAFTILTAKDSAENVEKGRKYIMYAALGLLVGFMAKAVPQIVKFVAGFGNQ